MGSSLGKASGEGAAGYKGQLPAPKTCPSGVEVTVPFPGVLGAPEISLAKHHGPQSSPENFIFTALSPPTHIHNQAWGRAGALH